MDWDQNQWVKYASEISGNDLDFISTLESENALWSPDRQSLVYSNGVREPSFGFCQIHADYHPEIVGDPNFKDPYWQLRKCYDMYKGGVTFYGFYSRNKVKDKFYLTN